MTNHFLSVAEVAQQLGVTDATVRRYVASGALPAVKLGDAKTSPLRIPRVSVENYLVGHMVTA